MCTRLCASHNLSRSVQLYKHVSGTLCRARSSDPESSIVGSLALKTRPCPRPFFHPILSPSPPPPSPIYINIRIYVYGGGRGRGRGGTYISLIQNRQKKKLGEISNFRACTRAASSFFPSASTQVRAGTKSRCERRCTHLVGSPAGRSHGKFGSTLFRKITGQRKSNFEIRLDRFPSYLMRCETWAIFCT